jgi:hypothetical protein
MVHSLLLLSLFKCSGSEKRSNDQSLRSKKFRYVGSRFFLTFLVPFQGIYVIMFCMDAYLISVKVSLF